jgi:hypothetical protein
MELPVEMRKKAYLYALKFLEDDEDGSNGGFCWIMYKAMKDQKLDVDSASCTLTPFPELMEYKPANMWRSTGFWFDPNDLLTRKDILRDILGKLTV